MTLDPELARLIDTLDAGFPPVHTMTGAEARAAIHARAVPNPHPEAVFDVSDREVPVQGGAVPIRIYRPAPQDGLPVLVFAHGGGFVFCDLDSHDGLCRSLANLIPAVVVSVGYRRAPEHRWPTAAQDVYAVTRWAAHLGDTLLVGGDSAGGNLAAVTAVLARDDGGPELAGQLLVYPVLAADFDTASYRRFGRGYYNPSEAMRWYWDQYVPDPADRRHPYASPLHADTRDLPPAVVVLAGHDPLDDEGSAYAAALQSGGVPVTTLRYEGAVHGFLTMPMLTLARRARHVVSSAVADVVRNSRAAPRRPR